MSSTVYSDIYCSEKIERRQTCSPFIKHTRHLLPAPSNNKYLTNIQAYYYFNPSLIWALE